MQTFLEKIPSDPINSSDDLSQIAARQNSQEVRRSPGHSRAFTGLVPPPDECM